MKNKNWKQSKIIKNKRGDYTYNPSYGIGSYLMSKLVIDELSFFFKNDITPKNVLDVGCGFMPHYIFLKDKLDYKDYIGVDWGNSPHKDDNVDFYINLNEPLTLDGKYDLILLMDVIEHLQDVNVLFKSLKLNLAKEGSMYITVPFFYWIHEAPFDFNRYTIFQLKNILKNNGFEIEEYKIVGGFGTSLIDLLSKNVFRPLKLNSLFTRKLLYLINNVFEVLSLNKNKETYPIEYIIKVRHL
jgi:SAM-dependent methyltransferase